MSTYGFKDGIVVANVHARHQTSAPYQPCGDVAENVTVQIGHHHHVKLLRARYHLKTTTRTLLRMVISEWMNQWHFLSSVHVVPYPSTTVLYKNCHHTQHTNLPCFSHSLQSYHLQSSSFKKKMPQAWSTLIKWSNYQQIFVLAWRLSCVNLMRLKQGSNWIFFGPESIALKITEQSCLSNLYNLFSNAYMLPCPLLHHLW